MAKAKKPKLKMVKAGELTQDQENARYHTKHGKAALAGSMEQFGPGRSVVLDGKDVIRAGNSTAKTAAEAGIEDVAVLEVDGTQLVAVQRDDWSDEEAVAYAIADNKISDMAQWQEGTLGEQLVALEEAGVATHAELGFTDSEFEKLTTEPTERPDEDAEFAGEASNVRVVHLFFDETTIHDFRQMEAKLAERFDTDNAGSTVLKCLMAATSGGN